jgi:lipoate-protein ligase B
LPLPHPTIAFERLGEVPYREALDLQRSLVDRRAEGRCGDTVLLLSHPHVYTTGRCGDGANLLVPEEELAREGILLERTGRGGDITYHGPGQLVAYPVVKLPRPDLHLFVRTLEAILVEACAALGVAARAVPGLTGAWSGERKIASIGVGVRRWVTWHGFALNVSTDLSRFDAIHLCGLKGRKATSLSVEAGRPVTMEAAAEAVESAFLRHLPAVTERRPDEGGAPP